MQAFVSKGRMQPLLEAIPVKVIINDRTRSDRRRALRWRKPRLTRTAWPPTREIRIREYRG